MRAPTPVFGTQVMPAAIRPGAATRGDDITHADFDDLCADAVSLADALQACLATTRHRTPEIVGVLARVYGRQAARAAWHEGQAGRWADAAGHWLRACRYQPSNARYLLSAAAATLRSSNDLDAPETLLRRALAIDARLATAHTLLAEIQLRRTK